LALLALIILHNLYTATIMELLRIPGTRGDCMHRHIFSLTLIVSSLLVSCAAPYVIVPQIDQHLASSEQIVSAIDSAAVKLNFEIDRKSDSIFVLFRPPLNPWNRARIMETRTRVVADSVLMRTIGEAFSSEGSVYTDANEYAFIFNSAVAQELAFQNGEQIYKTRLPYKRWDVFGGLTLLNPGLGLYYAYNTPFTRNFGIVAGSIVGGGDLVCMVMALWPEDKSRRYSRTITPRGIGIAEMIISRAAVPVMYLLTMQFYRQLQDTPYYFDMDQFRKRAESGILLEF
jgi:hypothetical protein